MSRSYKTDGVVIRRVNYWEADRLITIFTKRHGKIIVLAKGIRKIRSRKAPHLELFNQVSLYLASGKNFEIVTESQTINSFPLIRTQLDRLAYAYRIIEIIDRLCPEREIFTDIFHLLLDVFRLLNEEKQKNLKYLTEQYIVKFLWKLGYLPKDKLILGEELETFLVNVMERKLKSDSLLVNLQITV